MGKEEPASRGGDNPCPNPETAAALREEALRKEALRKEAEEMKRSAVVCATRCARELRKDVALFRRFVDEKLLRLAEDTWRSASVSDEIRGIAGSLITINNWCDETLRAADSLDRRDRHSTDTFERADVEHHVEKRQGLLTELQQRCGLPNATKTVDIFQAARERLGEQQPAARVVEGVPPGLTRRAANLWQYIETRQTKDGQMPTYDDMTGTQRMGRGTVSKYLKELCGKGYLRKEGRNYVVLR